jgi:tetratricopeptide (TPR) repeat protein
MLARARLKQGIYAQRANKRDEALKDLSEAESLFNSLGDTGGVADAIRWQGTIAVDLGRLDDARNLFERAFKIAAPLNYIRLATELQILLADNARQRGDRASAIALAEQAIAAAREGDYRSAQARALVTLGASLRLQGEYARAVDAYKQSAEIAGAIGETRNQNSAISNSAVIDFLTGDLKTARQKFESVLVFDRQNGNNINTALRLNNLSRILVLQDELVEAEKLNAEECRLQEAIKSASAIAWCRTRLAEIWIEQGKKADADTLAKQIVFSDFGSAVATPIYYAHFARVQLALGHLDQAIASLDAADKVQAKAGIVEEQAIHVSVIRAEVEAAQGKRAAAIARLQKAIADANKKGLVTWSLDARLILSRLDPREAAATERAARDAGFAFIARKAHQIPQKQS